MMTKNMNTKMEPAVIEMHDPEGAEQVLKLLKGMEAGDEDDPPEEAAIRLSAMALMLSNIAAAHLVGTVAGTESDLGVGFAVEGGFLGSDIEARVIAPAFRIQQIWERNLLHDVVSDTNDHFGLGKSPKQDSPQYYEYFLLPASRARAMFQMMQKNQAQESLKNAPTRELAASAKPGQKTTPKAVEDEPERLCDYTIMGSRMQTLYREVLDYRVFIADGTTATGLEKRTAQAHLGRFLMHMKIDAPEGLARAGKILTEYARHRNIRRGDATLTLRADPVLSVGAGVLSRTLSPGGQHHTVMPRLLWLVESVAGCDLISGGKADEEPTSPTLKFQKACEQEICRRITFSDVRTHDLPGLDGHLGVWRKFLREREQKFPGISSAVENLPVALCYGLESLKAHRVRMDGANVIALAKWLVIRMCNRFAVATTDGRSTRVQQLATKLAGKLLEHGPMTVRELTRKCSRLKTADCQKALEWLADRRIADFEENQWGIMADAKVVRELLG